jgi:hypothetical protein
MVRVLAFAERACDALKVVPIALELRKSGIDVFGLLSHEDACGASSVFERFRIPILSASDFQPWGRGDTIADQALVLGGHSGRARELARGAAAAGVPIVRLDAGTAWGDDSRNPAVGSELDVLATLRVAPSVDCQQRLARAGFSSFLDPVSLLAEGLRLTVPIRQEAVSPGRFGHRTVVLAATNVDLCRATLGLVRDDPSVVVLCLPSDGKTPSVTSFPRVGVLPELEIDPLVTLVEDATLVVTDDPSLLEITIVLGTPCVVPGASTSERALVRRGVVRAAGTGRDRIAAELRQLLRDDRFRRELSREPALPSSDEVAGLALLIREVVVEREQRLPRAA